MLRGVRRGTARGNAAVSVSGALTAQLFTLVTGILAARVLGVEMRGHLALLWVVTLGLTLVGTTGVPVAVTYWIANEPGSAHRVMRTVWRAARFQIAGAMVIQVAILALAFGQDEMTVKISALISLTVLPSAVVLVYAMAVLQGLALFHEWTIARILPVFLYAVGTSSFWVVGRADLITLSIAWSFGYLVAAMYAIRKLRRALPAEESGSGGVSFGALQRFGGKSFIAATTPSDTLQIDQLLVGLFISPAALGLYVVAVAFTNLPRVVAQSIGFVAFPYIAQQPTRQAARASMWRISIATAVLTLAVVGSLEGVVGWLVPGLFGAEFTDAVKLTRILLAGALLVSVRRVLADAARGAGYPGLGSIAELVSTVILIPLMAILAGQYGVQGVAVSLVVASAVGLAILSAALARVGRLETQEKGGTGPAERRRSRGPRII